MNPLIAPSLLSADFSCLREDIRRVEEGGADLLHLDVMDGCFVPNITFGPPLIRSIRPHTRLLLEAHLMINDPAKFLEAFVAAGADRIIIHAEAVPQALAVLAKIRELGAQAGVSIKPKTPLASVEPYLPVVQTLLIMTVEPGFGGQAFLPETLPKIEAARALIDRHGYQLDIAVDGGINLETAPRVIAAGANVLIAGNAVFGQPDPAAVIRQLKNAKPA
ncbi:MAG: ribulose-phosphate 3-epimerase [candidate division FCPU426 bacterium]